MAKEATSAGPARSPRGTKPVSQAFFTALESIPEATRSAVAKAAQAMIRDELKNRRDRLKATAAKEKARTAVAAKKTPKAAAPAADQPEAPTPPTKRRSRKQNDVPVTA